ncbi:MAG: TlpA family protein disulfide reductase [Burkholderiaceae bacterium]|jgi:thiol-disulfide isomerase/thioredoxin
MTAAIVLESIFYLGVVVAAPLLYPMYLHRVKGIEKEIAYQHSRLFGLLVAGVLLLAAVAVWIRPVAASPLAANASVAHLVVGEPAKLPPLTLLDGSVWRLDSERGKVVIVEFWHTRCPFCNRQNPLLNAFTLRHRDKGLSVVTVSIDKKKADAQDYMKQKGYVFAAGLADDTWHAIFNQRKGLPQLFLIDRQGVVRAIEVREMFPDDIEELEKFL